MSRQGLMDDSGYMGFEECSRYEDCTDNFVAGLLKPYDVESIEDLVTNSYNKGKADMLREILEGRKKAIKEDIEASIHSFPTTRSEAEFWSRLEEQLKEQKK